MHKSVMRNFQWKGHVEALEDRRVMSADPLLGGNIQHHYFDDDHPLDHHLVAEPDFWLDTEHLLSLEDQLDRIEQSLYSAHNSTGLNSVVSNYGFTGIGQTVAVIDSGIAYDHFALGGGFGANYRVVGGWDFTGENDANPYDDGPEGSHGTHVAGIIGGSAGADKGVAPDVDLVALRVFDDAGNGYFSWVENALQWVIQNRNSFENPITAINLSLGVASWNSSSIPSWASLEDEFAQLKAAGVFIAVSAGNSYTTYNSPGLSYPAASPYVVPVMSVTDGGSLAYYSQRDPRGIAAPGSSIRSTVPDYVGNNNGIADDYATYSGTSMASPYIAGASVLIRQAMEFAGYTNITQDTIHDHMMNTGTSFVDAVTGLTFKRLNLQAAIDVLIPTDSYGSTVETAYQVGTIGHGSLATLDGVISTLDDVDYFKFTAATSGTVTLTAYNMTHGMTAVWYTYGIAGSVGGAQGETFTFDMVAGQTYTFGLSTGGGIGYYDLDIAVENAFTYTDWGTIAYSQQNGISNNGETWYRVQASQAGYMTVESMFNAGAGQINLALYNSSMQQVSAGNPISGTCRVDAYASAGQEFFVCVTGTNSNVNFRLSNLVSISGTTVNIAGTAGADKFLFTAGGNHTVTVNGVTHTFSSVAVSTFNFNGGSGSDSITMTGTAGNETAVLREGTAKLTGVGFVVNTTSTENATVYSGGGNDRAEFYDSAGNDVYAAWANDRAVMYSTNKYFNDAYGFRNTAAYATQGNDRAAFYDSTGNDVYAAWAGDRAVMYSTNNYFNDAYGFRNTTAYATQGNDRAVFYDSAGNDVYTAWANDRALMQSTNKYFNDAYGFRNTTAYATQGNDRAVFYDSAGNDVYTAWANDRALMQSTNKYFNDTYGFRNTTAYATQGNDRAVFYDSAGNDVYAAWANDRAVMYSTNNYFNDTYGFRNTTAYATQGSDRAAFYDSTGNDVYAAWASDRAVMYSTNNYFNDTYGFRNTTAYATQGNDRAVFYDSTGNDVYAAWASDRAVMYCTNNFFNDAYGFRNTTAYSTQGNDRAAFYDSTGNDVYAAWANDRAVMYSTNNYFNDTYGFRNTTAYATAGGSDRAVLYDSHRADKVGAFLWGAYISNSVGRNEARDFDEITVHLINGGNDETDIGAVDYAFQLLGTI